MAGAALQNDGQIEEGKTTRVVHVQFLPRSKATNVITPSHPPSPMKSNDRTWNAF